MGALSSLSLLLGCDCSGRADAPADASACAPGSEEPGCPCPGHAVECYEGAPKTLLVGACRGGVRACEDGVLAECAGQILPARETCDATDEDCDGTVDGDVCRSVCIGVDCERRWGEPPHGFHIGPGGGLVLDMPQDSDVAVLWIPELFTGTLAKVDTRERRVIARYRFVGEDACETREVKWSLTTGANGDVYVTTSSDGIDDGIGTARVLAIRNAGCIDRNADGVIETSYGPDDVLPLGEDECVKWTWETEHRTVVAYQRASWGGIGVDRVWLADGFTHRTWAVDEETGEETGAEVLLEEPDPAPGDPGDTAAPNAIDVDVRGRLYAAMNKPCWTTCASWVAVIDTASPQVEAFVEAPYEFGSFDQMVQDHHGRIWARSKLASYDSITDVWTVPDLPRQVGTIIGVPTGAIWATINFPPDSSEYLVAYDVDAGTWEVDRDVVFEGGAFALDRDGQIWEWQRPGGIGGCGSDATTSAWIWDPWTMDRELALDGALRGGIAVHDNPTGVTPLDTRTDPRSTIVTFEGCEPEGDTAWRRLDWAATVGAGTAVRLEIQRNASPSPDVDAAWATVGSDPPGDRPVRLGDAPPAPYLHVRATLVSNDAAAPPGERVSPELLRIEAAYECLVVPD